MLKKLLRLIKFVMADDGDRNYCKFSDGYINYKKAV